MARRDIPLGEGLRDSNPKINDNFTELYNGLAEPILWQEIEDKPEEYPPAPHSHEKLDRVLDVETEQRVVYVSPSGIDSGSGSSSAPWKTIQYAVDQAKTVMQPRNGTSAYKVFCADGTYSSFVVRGNLLSSFSALGEGGIWVKSENGSASGVIIQGGSGSTVLAYGSCTIDSVTLESDLAGVQVEGAPSTFMFATNCVLRRQSGSSGPRSAVWARLGTIISRNNSSQTDRLFERGLEAANGGTVVKVLGQPSGSVANEHTSFGGVIR